MASFEREGNWIFQKGADGNVIAEVTFPNLREGVVVINHTYVDDSLRGQGIAGKLVESAYDAIKADGKKAVLTCPYAVKWFSDRPDKSDIIIEA
ncbi:MAG: N-acetyltransferase [Clostridiales Family XIII bacterium]|nr:N-acetyltransferase [Clostridiales Family XIII bacterium]